MNHYSKFKRNEPPQKKAREGNQNPKYGGNVVGETHIQNLGHRSGKSKMSIDLLDDAIRSGVRISVLDYQPKS